MRPTILLLALFAVNACAGTPYVTGTYEFIGDSYRLDFTLHNELGDAAIWGWYVLTEDASEPFRPSEWTVRQTFREVGWWTDYNQPWDSLPPGQSLGGFGYTAASEPTVLTYYIPVGCSGSVTMVPIPEPSSLLALAGGLGGIGLLRRRVRGKG